MNTSQDALTALLAAVAAEPDDESPRLVLADWLEEHGQPERAELIRVQCAMSRRSAFEHYDGQRAALVQRCRHLLRRHGKAWVGAKPAGWSVNLERGLLVVEANGAGIRRLTESSWWAEHSPWVAYLRVRSCRDELLRFIIEHVPELPALDLNRPRVTPAGLRELTALKRMHTLWLWAGTVDDDGLRELAPLAWLRALHVNPDRPEGLTDEGVRHLAALTELRRLRLTRTAVTGATFDALARLPLEVLGVDLGAVEDASLSHLTGLSGLRALSLHGTRVTDRGLDAVAGLTALEQLTLSETAVTDAGLERVARLERLVQLWLGECAGVTDAGLRSLARLQKLRHLYLDETSLTDRGLDVLAGFVQLRALFLPRNDGVTPAGVKRLQAALPQCRIYY